MDNQREKFVELLEGAPTDRNGNTSTEALAHYITVHGAILPAVKVGSVVYCYSAENKLHAFIVNKIELCVEIEKLTAKYYGIGNTTDYPAIKFGDENIGKTVFRSVEEAKRVLEIENG